MAIGNDSYSIASGADLWAGRNAPSDLTGIYIASESTELPATSADQTLLLFLHSSGGANYSTGRQYRAVGSARLSHLDFTEIAWSTRNGGSALGKNIMQLRPVDYYGTRDGGFIRESRWLGFTSAGESGVRLITERRVDALVEWANAHLPISATRRCVAGGSMGAWGCITYALRRPEMFAAVYADRPRWRWTNYSAQTFSVYDWNDGSLPYSAATAPSIASADGGGSVYDRRINSIGFVSNTANKVPWIGWCIGRNDGFAFFEDQIDAVNALRAARRGFAFAWNDGNHTTGSILSQITDSYPYGLFELGKGYPLFEQCSLDQDPTVDLVGGINIGLTFRNVVESSSGWSCEVTHISSACTVNVSPISDVFTSTVTPQTINIPAANVWVPVSFGA